MNNINIELLNKEKQEQIVEIANIATQIYVYPLFLIFLICDYFYYKDYFEEFLFVRVLACFSVYFFGRVVSNSKTYMRTQLLCVPLILSCSMPITYMIFSVNDFNTPYTLGLALVVLGMSIGFRLSWFIHILVLLLSILPILIGGILHFINDNSNLFLFNMFILVGISLIASATKYFYEGLHKKEHIIRMKLNNEIVDRQNIITKKTNEAIKLTQLSAQFSPQVIKLVKKKGFSYFKEVENRNICAIFIDIADSTKKLGIIKLKDFTEVIEEFTDIVINTLLFYDITIDKFYGDGILAFSNQPIEYNDYVERICLASIEIRNKINNLDPYFKKLWKGDLEITMGISSGKANVGFYGSKTHIKQYSAIGESVILAQRLTSACNSNDILISEAVAEIIKDSFFIEPFKRLLPKGFDKEVQSFSLLSKKITNEVDDIVVCDICGSEDIYIMNTKGLYDFGCRRCETEDIKAAS